MNEESLNSETSRATEILSGKVVSHVHRIREEVLIEFTDGTRLFIDKSNAGIELSITSGIVE